MEETERVYQGGAVLFRYRGEGPATLRYLYTGLSGEVFYTLEEGRLTAWARFRLEGEALEAQRLTLLSPAGKALAFRTLEEPPPEAPFGLFRYELPGRKLLPGTTEIPFLKTEVAPERLLGYQAPFRTERLLPLERGYRFQAPFPLAPGVLEVSDGGLFLGKATMPPTPKGEGAEVWLGKDLEARLTRKVEQVGETEKEAGYRVEARLENPYPYPVVLLLSEVFPRPFRLDFPGATPLPEGYRLQATLKPREARTFVYRLTLPR